MRFTALRLRTFLLLRAIAFEWHDPTDQYAERGALVLSVSDAQHVENLHTMITIARDQGARPVLLAVCAMETKVNQMRDVAVAAQVPMVDALEIFVDRFHDLKARQVYGDEVRHYENIYGLDAMEENWRLYFSTDGCHPNLAGMNLIADGLAAALVGGAPGN